MIKIKSPIILLFCCGSWERIIIASQRMMSEGKGMDDLKNVRIPERYKDWWLANYFHPNLERLFQDALSR